MVKTAVTALAALLTSCAVAPSTTVTITDAWAQPLDASGRSLAVYMTVALDCSHADELQSVSAKSPLRASLHASSVADNALKMTPLTSIEVPCGKPWMLKPLANHVMVTGLGRPVEIGSTIPLTLTFRDGGKVDVTPEVTTMAVLENVDPMNMHGGSGPMNMSGMHRH